MIAGADFSRIILPDVMEDHLSWHRSQVFGTQPLTLWEIGHGTGTVSKAFGSNRRSPP